MLYVVNKNAQSNDMCALCKYFIQLPFIRHLLKAFESFYLYRKEAEQKGAELFTSVVIVAGFNFTFIFKKYEVVCQ